MTLDESANKETLTINEIEIIIDANVAKFTTNSVIGFMSDYRGEGFTLTSDEDSDHECGCGDSDSDSEADCGSGGCCCS